MNKKQQNYSPRILSKTIGAALLFAATAISQASTNPPPSNDLIVNGSFENGLTSWEAYSSGAYGLVDEGRTGWMGYAFNNGPSVVNYVEQGVRTVAGETYEISFWLKKNGAGYGGLYVYFENQAPFVVEGLTSTDGQFVQYKTTFKANYTGTWLEFYGYTSGGSMILDDVSVTTGTTEPQQPQDTTAPVITLGGESKMTVALNSNFKDPGATALDDVNGTVEVEVLGEVNTAVRGEYTITYSAKDAAGNLSSATRTVYVSGEAPLTVNDAVTQTGRLTAVYPLANDKSASGNELTIMSVSNPDVTVMGRTLYVPSGFTGTFSYTTSDGETTATGEVEVKEGRPMSNATHFTGLLYDREGTMVGWSSTTVSAKGLATTQLTVGEKRTQTKFTFKPGWSTASANTSLGPVQLQRQPDGTLALLLGTPVSTAATSTEPTPTTDSQIFGLLRPAATKAKAAKYHVALASVDQNVPGAGYLIASVKTNGTVGISGLLPDGRPFSASTSVSDNGTISFYTTEKRGVLRSGLLGGELVTADLVETDLTGEIAWLKPEQGSSNGLHMDGVSTILTANGCVYAGQIPLNGYGELTISGAGFEGEEVTEVKVAGGIPLAPVGAIKTWDNVKPAIGQFRVKVNVPGIAKPVSGQGIYLPKAHKAWGYFPGTNAGGRIELHAEVEAL